MAIQARGSAWWEAEEPGMPLRVVGQAGDELGDRHGHQDAIDAFSATLSTSGRSLSVGAEPTSFGQALHSLTSSSWIAR